MTTMMEGVPAVGFRTLGEIDGTNGLRFQPKQTAMDIALELLSSHTSGAPIVNDAGKFVGFVSEFDLLGAIESGQDLSQITADKLMNTDHYVADESTSIADAILMHEGQAAGSQQQFRRLNVQQRRELLAFLNSL